MSVTKKQELSYQTYVSPCYLTAYHWTRILQA